MATHPLAGKPAPQSMLTNIPRLMAAYFANHPDSTEESQRVSFGTSGHRGTSLNGSFNEDHILAITQAVYEHRRAHGIDGPLFIGMDTHGLSEAAFVTAVEVLAAAGVEIRYQKGLGYTPTPVVSHAILSYNQGRRAGLADGIVITPSHNPPDNGGFKYNPPHGGPADTDVTRAIETRANELLPTADQTVRRISYQRAIRSPGTHEHDYVRPYVDDLANVVDVEAIAAGKLRIGVDPLGGAGLAFWDVIAERHGIDLDVVNRKIDPAFSFMPLDKDGKIRMDCSSPYAMAGLIGLKDRYDIAFGNDPDYDRHGIVTKTGLMNPNHYLAVAIHYLFPNRPAWPEGAAVGKTLVSSSMIDRVAVDLGRRLSEVPVGFKWFVDGLITGEYGFGGEESAGASFLRRDGSVWTTDKDGIIMDLLAAEIMVRTGKDPSQLYRELTARFGEPVYERMDAPASPRQKAALARLSPGHVSATTLAGESITAALTHAPGNGAAIGGLKVTTRNGWFAARPSGTEDVFKVYAESFKGREHLERIQEEALAIVGDAFRAAGAA